MVGAMPNDGRGRLVSDPFDHRRTKDGRVTTAEATRVTAGVSASDFILPPASEGDDAPPPGALLPRSQEAVVRRTTTESRVGPTAPGVKRLESTPRACRTHWERPQDVEALTCRSTTSLLIDLEGDEANPPARSSPKRLARTITGGTAGQSSFPSLKRG